MEGVGYTQVRLRPPFRVRAPLGEDWRLYLIRRGAVMFEAGDAAGTRLRLPEGSVVALSGVLQHRFSSEPGEPGEPAGPVQTDWVEGPLTVSAPAGIAITVGRIAKSRLMFLALFDHLIAIPADRYPQAAARIAHALEAIAGELERGGPESEIIVRKLSEIMALEIGRLRRTDPTGQSPPVRRAQPDARILRAVAAFYAAPEEKWSVERLAEVAAMSRTAFAVRYRELIGATPLKSVRQLRMQLAADELARAGGSSRLRALAAQLGYRSDAAFIRAFAKEFGVTPGSLARRGQDHAG